MSIDDPKFTPAHWLQARRDVTAALTEAFGRAMLETSAGFECVDALCDAMKVTYLRGREEEATEQVSFRLQEGHTLRHQLVDALVPARRETVHTSPDIPVQVGDILPSGETVIDLDYYVILLDDGSYGGRWITLEELNDILTGSPT